MLIGFLSRQGTIKEDTAIGILFAAALSLGVLLISSIRTYAVDLTHIMFGNVLGVSTSDLIVTAAAGDRLCWASSSCSIREFLVMSFDPVLAATLRMRAERFRTLMLILLALTIVVSLQTVGVGLVAAMLVTPGAAAYLLTRRLSSMMIVAALIGAAVERGGSVSEFLSQRGVRRGGGADGHSDLPAGLPVRSGARLTAASVAHAQRKDKNGLMSTTVRLRHV